MRDGIEVGCEHLERYISSELTKTELRDFELHAETCSECGEEMKAWSRLYKDIAGSLVTEAEECKPSMYEARALAVRAREQSKPSVTGWVPRFAWAFVGGLAATAAFLFYFWVSPAERIDDGMVVAGEASSWIDVEVFDNSDSVSSTKRLRFDEELEAGVKTRLIANLGRDRVGVDNNSKMRVTELNDNEVRIEFNEGTIACDVEPRTGGEKFRVIAGTHEIIVVGTKFSAGLASDGSLKVAVSKGVVEVRTGKGRVQRVSAGVQLEVSVLGDARLGPIDAEAAQTVVRLLQTGEGPSLNLVAKDPEPTPFKTEVIVEEDLGEGLPEKAVAKETTAQKSDKKEETVSKEIGLSEWKQWILEGRVAEAEKEIVGHLASHPEDYRAWAVLAHARRKLGKWSDSLEAYLSAAESGPATSVNQYRFRAGALLQDQLNNQGRAVIVFEEFLARPGGQSVRLVAKLRLANGYLATGRNGDAKRLLEEIVGSHEGTEAAREARKMLDEMGGK